MIAETETVELLEEFPASTASAKLEDKPAAVPAVPRKKSDHNRVYNGTRQAQSLCSGNRQRHTCTIASYEFRVRLGPGIRRCGGSSQRGERSASQAEQDR